MVKRGDMLNTDDVVGILSIKLIGVVPDDESIIISTNQGRPAVIENGSTASRAFKNIAARVMGQDTPFIDLHEEKSFMKKLSKFLGI
jgi:septum site-determining protein MinD